MKLQQATLANAHEIWDILQFAIESRRQDGSAQWQDGYPNLQTVMDDINQGHGYVLCVGKTIACYCAVLLNDEPAYQHIEGKWLSTDNFLVIHRVAVAPQMKGKGLVQHLFKALEQLAISQHVFSIRVDTNFDNAPMLSILHKLGYTYCGEVYFRGSARKAYQKTFPF